MSETLQAYVEPQGRLKRLKRAVLPAVGAVVAVAALSACGQAFGLDSTDATSSSSSAGGNGGGGEGGKDVTSSSTGGSTSTSSTGTGGAGGAEGIPCDTVDDCPKATDCATPICINNVCDIDPVAAGVVSGVANDCKQVMCDGEGNSEEQSAPNEVPVQDGNLCDTEVCSGTDVGVVNHLPVADGTVVDTQKGDCKEEVCTGGVSVSQSQDGDIPNDGNACTVGACSNGVPSNVNLQEGAVCDDAGVVGICDAAVDCVPCDDTVVKLMGMDQFQAFNLQPDCTVQGQTPAGAFQTGEFNMCVPAGNMLLVQVNSPSTNNAEKFSAANGPQTTMAKTFPQAAIDASVAQAECLNAVGYAPAVDTDATPNGFKYPDPQGSQQNVSVVYANSF